MLLATSAARADGPVVDVADLPPLPAAEDEPSSSATVLAAASAEEDVVVGAAKREQSLGNVASAVTVISGDRIRRFGYRTIGEAVASVAGVYLVDNRLSYSVGVRGLQIPGDFNTRLLVLVDGASINEAWGAFAGLGYDAIVSIEDIARIEVIRGPVSSVYGTNAFFGIINIVTRSAADSPRAWVRAAVNSIQGVTTSTGFAAGSVHEQVRGSVHFMNRIGETLNLDIPDGNNLAFDGSRSFVAGVVGAYGGSFAQVRASRYRRESPFAPYDVNPLIRPYEQFDTQLIVEGGHTREVSKRLSVAGRVYTNLYKFSDTSPPYDPVTGYTLDTTGEAQVFGGEIRGRYEIVRPNLLGITAGTEASYDRTRSTALVVGDPASAKIDVPTNYNLEGIYTEVDGQPLPWLGFIGGLRFDLNSKLEDRLSPRAALFVAQPEKAGVKLLYAEGFRNASAFEGTFEDGVDFLANPDIKAETIRSFEAVAWAKPTPGLAARLSGFYWDARGIIESVPADIDPNKLQFQNVTRYVSAGAEAEVSFRGTSGWYAFGGAAYTHVGTEDDMGNLVYGTVANAPAITASVGLSTPKLGDIAHISAEAIAIGPRPTRVDAAGNPSPDAPAWVGANLTVYVPNVKGFDLTAGVRNLIGTRDQIPAPGDYDRSTPDVLTVPRVPGEGRELYVKVGYAY
ncbi:MAG: TonB-dependent receptor [Polyangiales bacterium]